MSNHSKKIQDFFSKQLQNYGPDDYRSVVWSTKESQITRFRILAEVADVKNKTILDVGSGLSDLYAFLKPLHITYTGIELSEIMPKESIKKYDGIDIILDDFLTYKFARKFDYVLCSGAFNLE